MKRRDFLSFLSAVPFVGAWFIVPEYGAIKSVHGQLARNGTVSMKVVMESGVEVVWYGLNACDVTHGKMIALCDGIGKASLQEAVAIVGHIPIRYHSPNTY